MGRSYGHGNPYPRPSRDSRSGNTNISVRRRTGTGGSEDRHRSRRHGSEFADARRGLSDLHLGDRRRRGQDPRARGGVPKGHPGRIASFGLSPDGTHRTSRQADCPTREARKLGGDRVLESGIRLGQRERTDSPPAVAAGGARGGELEAPQDPHRDGGRGSRGGAAPSLPPTSRAANDGNREHGRRTNSPSIRRKQPGTEAKGTKGDQVVPRMVQGSIDRLRNDLNKVAEDIKQTLLKAIIEARTQPANNNVDEHVNSQSILDSALEDAGRGQEHEDNDHCSIEPLLSSSTDPLLSSASSATNSARSSPAHHREQTVEEEPEKTEDLLEMELDPECQLQLNDDILDDDVN